MDGIVRVFGARRRKVVARASLETSEVEDTVVGQGPELRDNGLIDLRLLFIFWVKWSWTIIPFAVVALYLGYQELKAFQPQFLATMVVAPNGGGSAPAGGLSSAVGNALGVSIGGSSSVTLFDRLEVMVGSVVLATQLQKEQNLLYEVFAGSWDDETKTWVVPQGEEFEKQQRRLRFLRKNTWVAPNLESLARFVGGTVKIQTEKGSFKKISVQHVDPDFAVRILSLVYFTADELLREQDRAESKNRRRYLDAQLASAVNLDSRNALVSLLTSEQRRSMLLESELPYAARIIEPVFVSQHATEPNLQDIFLMRLMFSVIAGLVILTGYSLLRNE